MSTSYYDKKTEFYKKINELKPTSNEENVLSKLKKLTTKPTSVATDEAVVVVKCDNSSTNNNAIQGNIESIKNIHSSFTCLNNKISSCFNKLNHIIESRNTLTCILQAFSNETNEIFKAQDKHKKLTSSIQKILKFYSEPLSISSFLSSNPNPLESNRYFSDYEFIDSGVIYFNMHRDYFNSDSLIKQYKELKTTLIRKAYDYLKKHMNYFENQTSQDKESEPNKDLNKIIQYIDNNILIPLNMNKKLYELPVNFLKIKAIYFFLEKKAKTDDEVYEMLLLLKKTYINERINLLRPFINEMLYDKSLYDSLLGITEDRKCLFEEIIKLTLSEVLYFKIVFQCKLNDNHITLNTLLTDIYTSLYNNIRPLIVQTNKLDLLSNLYNKIVSKFDFLLVEKINKNFILNKINKLKETRKDGEMLSNTNDNKDIDYAFFEEMNSYSKKSLSNLIIKMIKDTQEKLVFECTIHSKEGLANIEDSFFNYELAFELIGKSHKNFKLFHDFLKKCSIIFSLLYNKIDIEILSDFAVIFVDQFIALMTKEAKIHRSSDNFPYQIFIVQQIILMIKVTESYEFNIGSDKAGLQNITLTELFKQNLFDNFTVLSGNEEKSIFKRNLYNTLIKNYKVLSLLVNDFIFGKDIVSFVTKKDKEKISDYSKIDLNSYKSKFSEVAKNLSEQIEEIDFEAYNKIYYMIKESFNKILDSLLKNIDNENSNFILIKEGIEALIRE